MSAEMHHILAQYPPALAGLTWVSLANAGGFSGAALWRGEVDGVPAFALKCWPAAMNAERLDQIHRWMKQAERCDFVPVVVRTNAGPTFAARAGQLWDACRWMPGEPSLTTELSVARIAAAFIAAARLHRLWRAEAREAIVPAVLNRLHVIEDYRSREDRDDAIRFHQPALFERICTALDHHLDTCAADLRSWTSIRLTAQPCVRDLRADHVLFTADRVTGIIDYGAMAVDHPAVDLARLLIDVDCTDAAAECVPAYRDNGGEPSVSLELIRTLMHSGLICSLIGWLRRWQPGNPRDSALSAATLRIEHLLMQLESSRRS